MYPGLPTRLEKDIRDRYLKEVLKGEAGKGMCGIFCVVVVVVKYDDCGDAVDLCRGGRV
jgi:hypothetical protein